VFKKELSPYKTSTGVLSIPIDKPIPYPLDNKDSKILGVKENLEKVLR